jgi:hypothetical protein
LRRIRIAATWLHAAALKLRAAERKDRRASFSHEAAMAKLLPGICSISLCTLRCRLIFA